MPAEADSKARAIGDELAELRDQVQKLMKERVTPGVSRLAGHAEDYAKQAADEVRQRADQFSGTVRDQPITAVLVAAALGYLVGRVTR